MKELSTRNFVMVLMDGSRIFLELDEAEIVKNALKKGEKYLEIGESLILSSHVVKVISGSEYEEFQKTKQGDWKCTCGNWIPKGMRCGYC